MTSLAQAAQAVELVETQGMSQRGAARHLGLPHGTVRDIINGNVGWDERKDTPVFMRYRAEQKALLIHAMTEGAKAALLHAHQPAVLEKASYLQAVTGVGILIDKARLLAGEPTEISASLNVNAAASLDEIAAALAGRLTSAPGK